MELVACRGIIKPYPALDYQGSVQRRLPITKHWGFQRLIKRRANRGDREKVVSKARGKPGEHGV